MMLGGSPHIVAEPPRFAQNISDKIIGTGLNLSSLASSTVTAARNKITVILSMNIARNDDIIINEINKGMVLYFTSLASLRHSHLKKPAFAIPSTIIIIPAIKIIVDQLIPDDSSSFVEYQKLDVNMLLTLSVFTMALPLCIISPNTTPNVNMPHASVT